MLKINGSNALVRLCTVRVTRCKCTIHGILFGEISADWGSAARSTAKRRGAAQSAAERRARRCAPLRAAPHRSALLTCQPSREKCKTQILREEEGPPDFIRH